MPPPLPDGAKACDSGLDNDFKYEACDPFCSTQKSCMKCKCRTCALCTPPSPPPNPHPPPPPPPPVLDAMGCAFKYTVVKSWSRGFGGEVVPNEWEVGKKVLIEQAVRSTFTPARALPTWDVTFRAIETSTVESSTPAPAPPAPPAEEWAGAALPWEVS